MHKYQIYVSETYSETVSISANSEEEALQKFNELYESGGYTVLPASSDVCEKFGYSNSEVLGEDTSNDDGNLVVNLDEIYKTLYSDNE